MLENEEVLDKDLPSSSGTNLTGARRGSFAGIVKDSASVLTPLNS
jgi:hypothetical protein